MGPALPMREQIEWSREKRTETLYRGICSGGVIEIRKTGSVMCGISERVWPVLAWEASGDGFRVTGRARSLARAKEDAVAALRALGCIDFETATPRDEERRKAGA